MPRITPKCQSMCAELRLHLPPLIIPDRYIPEECHITRGSGIKHTFQDVINHTADANLHFLPKMTDTPHDINLVGDNAITH